MSSGKEKKSDDIITALKPKSQGSMKPFLVADIETVLIDNVHKPYAIGLMKVFPDASLSALHIETFFSEDYSIILDQFEDKSIKL